MGFTPTVQIIATVVLTILLVEQLVGQTYGLFRVMLHALSRFVDDQLSSS